MDMPISTSPTFDEARAQFPVLERCAYLNAGTFGPLPRVTIEALVRESERDLLEGRAGMPWYERALTLRERVREALGALVGVPGDRVALTDSTTTGCNIVAAGLELGPGAEIVTTTAEHPGLLLPLHATGARVVPVAPTPEAILGAITARTRLLALSQVLWTDGTILPVRALRESSGLPVLVDGAQSVGAIPVDADAFDYLTISGQKWLCGPDMTGALVVNDPEQLRVALPSYFSKTTLEPDGSYVPKDGAARFDPNWISVGALEGLLAALTVRPPWWYERAVAAAERCRALLAQRFDVVVPEHRATLVACRVPGDVTAAVETLRTQNVHVREIPGTGLLRVSCGWWTSDGDLDRLFTALP